MRPGALAVIAVVCALLGGSAALVVAKSTGWFDAGSSEVSGKVRLGGRVEFSGRTTEERKRNLNGALRVFTTRTGYRER